MLNFLFVDILHLIIQYLGPHYYCLIAETCKSLMIKDVKLNIGSLIREGSTNLISYYLYRMDRSKVCVFVSKYGNSILLEWCLTKQCILNRYCSIEAAKSGNLDTLKCIVKRGGTIDKRVSLAAAKYNQIDILMWMQNEGLPIHYKSWYIVNGN